MVTFKKVQSIDEPAIQKFASRREAEVEPFDELIIDSERVIRRAIESGVTLKSILMTENYVDRVSDILQSLNDVVVYIGTTDFVQRFVGQRVHQNMMALAVRPKPWSLDDIDDRAVFLNGNNDAQNVGAIVRNCHALGVTSILIDRFTCSPYARRSIRVSMGSVFRMKIIFLKNMTQDLLTLKHHGFEIVSSHLAESSVPLDDFKFSKKSVLVIGSEFEGVSQEVASLSDHLVKIPISQDVDSLNAACASAILLDSMRRQRTS